MCFSPTYQKTHKSLTKSQLPFALALSLAKCFAFLKMSAMDGVVSLFKENVYFIRTYKLIMHKSHYVTLHHRLT